MSPVIQQLEEHIRGAWRFRWYALVAAWVVAGVGWLIIFAMPDRYEATASVFVDTRTPLTPALQGLTVQQDVNSELNYVRQSLLAGAQLETLAQVTGVLPASQTDPVKREKVLDEMRKRIQLTMHSPSDREDAGTVYDLIYEDANQGRSLKLIQILLRRFVDETLGGKRQGSEGVQQFLMVQIKDYEKRLRTAEDRLADFKTRHLGLMPSEQGGYFAQLQKQTDAVADLQIKLRTAEGRRNTLQSQLRGDAAVAAIGTTPVVAGVSGMASGTDTVSRIAQAQAHLDELLLNFTDKHPDVIAARQTLAELKERRAQEIESLRRGDPNAVAASHASTNPVYQSIQLALNQAELDVSDLRTQLAEHQTKMQELRKLVTTAPQVEAEYAQLNRDYDVNKTQYTALLGSLEKARLSEKADNAGSIRFEIVQAPIVSAVPVSPRRGFLLAVVLLVALGAGGALAYALDQLFPVFDSALRLAKVTGLEVLGAVGEAFPIQDKHRARVQGGLIALTVLCLMATFAVVYVLSHDGYRVRVSALKQWSDA